MNILDANLKVYQVRHWCRLHLSASSPASVRRNLPEDNNSDQDVMSTRRLESDAGDNLENDDNGNIFRTFCLISGPCPLLLALLKILGTKHAMPRSYGWAGRVGPKNKNN